ncbi:MAG: TnpV protein [Lachnospiraceae bacterium]|nr:TnpV protein [Lachnospiraceae bacterium]
MQSTYERMGGIYTLGADGMYYPDLAVYEEEEPHYGKYGRMRKAFLKEHHAGLYSSLLLTGKLTSHLNEIDDAANDRMELLVQQMQKRQHIDEALKARDQMTWVGAMNNIRNAAEEVVLEQLIYS